MPNISPHSVYFFNISITFFNFNHVFQYKIKTDKSEKLPVRVDEVGLKPRPSLVTPEALSFLKTFLVSVKLKGYLDAEQFLDSTEVLVTLRFLCLNERNISLAPFAQLFSLAKTLQRSGT